MINCFPRPFVVNGPDSIKRITRLRAILWAMIYVLIMSIMPPFSHDVAVAQSNPDPVPIETVPPGCRDDNGNPVEPINGEGAWAIILNFNHPKSSEMTVACLAIVETMTDTEKTVVYDPDFRCPLVNNINSVEVGGGKAIFDGNFKIVCPRHIHENAEDVKYEKFYVHAKARFPEVAARYQLIRHKDVAVAISFDPADERGMWNARLSSRYGAVTFADTETVEMIPEHRFGIQSTIFDGQGTHHINRDMIETRRPVDPFPFDFDHLIHIGGEGADWTLYNIVIDPPSPDIGCC